MKFRVEKSFCDSDIDKIVTYRYVVKNNDDEIVFRLVTSASYFNDTTDEELHKCFEEVLKGVVKDWFYLDGED